MAGFLDEHDLKPTSAGKYIMNASTGPKWIGFIASILDRVHQTFDDESNDSTTIQDGNKKTERKSLDKGRVEAIDALIRVLYLIFAHREVQILFGLDSLRKFTLGTLPTNAAEVDHGEFSFFFACPILNVIHSSSAGH
jgi:hypothetical protein